MDTEGTNARLVEPSRSTPTMNWTGIVLFIVLTFGISWATWLGLRALGVPFVIRTASGMFGTCPRSSTGASHPPRRIC